MEFKELLEQYMTELGCTAKELAQVSGLPASTISRYRLGGRTPAAASQQLVKLAEGIGALAGAKGIPGFGGDAVLEKFVKSLSSGFDSGAFAARIDYVIRELNINVASMAKVLNYDASFLSRIRAGNRMPADFSEFARKFSAYVVKNYDERDIMGILERQVWAGELEDGAPETGEPLTRKLEKYLLNGSAEVPDRTASFLHRLDDFDLNEYIRSIRFDELKVPSVPFQFHTARRYSGVEGQKDAELDFLKNAVLSRSKEPVFMCSDMDMIDMAEDMEFSKKWMLGVAMLLKKKQTIRMVHNLNRPFSELMLGLEAWIPLYMMGQVIPYYVSGVHNNLYQHMLYTSGEFALSGECVKGFHGQGRYLLTGSREDVAYYRERADCILKRASSLMDIYTADNAAFSHDFYDPQMALKGDRHYISSTLPIFVLPDDFLAGIWSRNHLPEVDCGRILEKLRERREGVGELLRENKLLQEVPLISEEEFGEHPLVLDLTEYGYYTPVPYSYDDYREHLGKCGEFAGENGNYIFRPNREFAFRNIQIRILEGKWVWISKIKSPTVHFVIRHPLLRGAIENMYVPVHE